MFSGKLNIYADKIFSESGLSKIYSERFAPTNKRLVLMLVYSTACVCVGLYEVL